MKMAYSEIVPYKRGSRWFTRDGHFYVVYRTRGASVSMRCASDKCPVRWILRDEVAGPLNGEHDHPLTPWVPDRNAMFQALKKRAASETIPLSAIYEEEAARYPDAAPRLLWENVYPSMRKWRQSVNEKSYECQVDDQDADSNSSIKFSSEILGQFQQHGARATCTVCRKSMDHCLEDMKSHLEAEHPEILISILNNKSHADGVMYEEVIQEEAIDEDAFTEVVYLEEEQKPMKNSLKRSRPRFSDNYEQSRFKIKKESVATPQTEQTDTETFLNYIGVLIKKVPEESLHKLQLDVICLILNAHKEKARNPSADAPVCASMSSTGKYQITIQNDDVSESGA